jgi:Ca-activated chloride channel family protein
MLEALLNNEMVWRAPIWLWALLLPVAVAIIQRVLRNSQKQNYADSHLWQWVAVQDSRADFSQTDSVVTRPGYLKRVINQVTKALSWLLSPIRLLSLAWLCLVIAIAGPRSLDSKYDVQTRNGVDVMIDIDLSQSMTAKDVQPNRFLFAKSISESLVSQLQANDRVALSVFAGQPHSVIPLTYDKHVFDQALNLIEPGMLPTKGSWIDLALIDALNVFTQTGRPAKVLVVFTDGAPPFWKPVPLPAVVADLPVAKSQKQSDTGVKVIFVGVGKNRSTTIPDKSHSSGKLHANGLLVQTRLEESQLMKMAERTEGVYLKAETGQAFMQKLLDEVLQTSAFYQDKTVRKVWHNYSQPFMVVGVISLLLAFYLWQIGVGLKSSVGGYLMARFVSKSIVKAKSNQSSSVNSIVGGFLVIPIVALVSLNLWSTPSQADTSVKNEKENLQQAYQAFESESFELAESLYDLIPNYQGWFGAGAAAYKLDDLEAAVLYFRQAAWQAKTDIERAQALYNLGNSYYKANLLPQAIESYTQALKYQSPYKKAEHNLALANVRHKLEMQGKLKKANKKKGEDKGGKGSDSQGAFYGGQKVGDSNSKEAGSGADDDAPNGNKTGKKINLPEADELTDYHLNPSIAKLRLNSLAKDKAVNSVVRVQQNQQRAEKFEHELQQLKDDQKMLLKRLFEREEGFQAQQEKAHDIPGIQPW